MGGFFGTISKGECAHDLYYGTDYNSHLGTRRGGIVTYDGTTFQRTIHNLENAYFRSKFESDLPRFKGKSGIGVISDTDSQPIVLKSHHGRFAITTVAHIHNLDNLAQEMIQKGKHFSEFSSGNINQTELISLLVDEGNTFEEGIEHLFNKIQGSCSLLLLTEFGIIAARDKLGRTPVIIAKKEGAYAVSSEPCGFPNLGFETEYFLGPGEMVHITADGFTQLRKPNKKMQICSFLYVYYGYPVSDYENINVDEVRYKAGFENGKQDTTDADFISAIPDSGIGYALGYAAGKGIPYKRAMIKYTPTWPRSFTPANQSMRNLVAKMKLIPNKTLLRNKRVIFSDDSIVRGTQLKDNVEFLYGYGAKEVHMRISAPPLLYPCKFIGFSAQNSDLELITRRIIQDLEGDHTKHLDLYQNPCTTEHCAMVDCMRKRFNLTSLKFNTIEGLVKAIGLPKEQICTHCFDGSSYF
ncbi:MAG: amidophosphoribosyltransferase [Sphingobacteriia bacterium]|jgi:amidophosphoribosyltransferase|nr:amidophosphoribosyltransferase [Paludibacteraceae bacterium]NCA78768.1 amidophosphoribosyltransferase [Sphingobacteriia bacterium]